VCEFLTKILQIHKLCQNYGQLVGYVGTEAFYDFPTPDALAVAGTESRLRELGFGYRAKYIAATANLVAHEKPEGWLESLRNPEYTGVHNAPPITKSASQSTYKFAHEQLLELPGVGPKVADCICLMGLGWSQAVPVDTHVWKIAQRDYGFGKGKAKTFNKAMYDSVGDHFREIWGHEAGWAHLVLFTADLRAFSNHDNKTMTGDTSTVVKVEVSQDGGLSHIHKRQNSTEVVVATKRGEKDNAGVSLATARSSKRRRL
jgi:N-glycosylase/DNA lyase